MTSAVIETFRLVAQYLNQLHYRVTVQNIGRWKNFIRNKVILSLVLQDNLDCYAKCCGPYLRLDKQSKSSDMWMGRMSGCVGVAADWEDIADCRGETVTLRL